MSKAFISILGTNNYLECRHRFPDKFISVPPVKYVQEDLVKYFCKDWNKEDEIRIFLTKDAKEKNWYNDGHKDNNKQSIPNKGLEERLKDLGLKSKIKPIDIKEGFNEDEIWDIFQTIYELFRPGEEVIVDITHSFRSLPMLMISLLNYAKQMKKINILGIYYAAFETLGSIQEINQIPVDKRVTPILNLTSFSDLQDWTNATFDFVNNGNVSQIEKIVKQSESKSIHSDPITKFFPRKVIEKLNKMVANIALCRGKELLNFDYDGLKQDIDKLKLQNVPKPFKYLIDEIQNKISGFDNDPKKLTLTITYWCVEHNLFQQAITLLQEFTISMIFKEIDIKVEDKKIRTIVSQAFRIKSENLTKDKWQEPASSEPEIVEKILSMDLTNFLHTPFNKLTKIRNDVNHAGFLDSARNIESIKCKLNQTIDLYKEALK